MQVVSRRPFSMPPKHCQRCISLGKRVSPVQLRVGAPFTQSPQSSQRSGGFHKPAVPRAALGDCDHLRLHAAACGRFCKEILPGQHRLEDPISNFRASGSAGIEDPTDRESVSLGGASPLSPTNFMEPKPQQTGTGLLIRYGEVATTSGSTNLFQRGRYTDRFGKGHCSSPNSG